MLGTSSPRQLAPSFVRQCTEVGAAKLPLNAFRVFHRPAGSPTHATCNSAPRQLWLPVASGKLLSVRAASGQCRHGFTVIELLVVIAIVGVLVVLLLPAIQAARDASRRACCQNQLRQIGLALLTQHDRMGHFPTAGWGAAWVGMPGRGIADDQPGGWIYCVLPYLEQGALRDSGNESLDQGSRLAQLLATPISVFNCPSRRSPEAWTTGIAYPHLRQPRYCDPVASVARSDYAANGGSRVLSTSFGPDDFTHAYSSYNWPRDWREIGGIFAVRSQCRVQDIADGLSNTLLLGDKYLSPEHYYDGVDPGDNESMYNGYCTDIVRYGVQMQLSANKADRAALLHDANGVQAVYLFGSAHPGGCNLVMADGSCRVCAYNTDLSIMEALSCRFDSDPPDVFLLEKR